MTNAKGFIKNPLGIIGLFISLIYGFACLVLSTSISNLESPAERMPLIWFIVIFPIIILGAFVYLVVNHHEKLYAPGDFRDDRAFIETMSAQRIREKQESEASVLSAAEEEKEDPETSRSSGVEFEKKYEIKESNESVRRPLKPDKTEILHRFANVEKWAIQELEQKYKMAFSTHQRLFSDTLTLEVDGIGENESTVILAEVKYWHANRNINLLLLSLQQFLLKAIQFRRAFEGKRVRIAIVIVFDEPDERKIDQITKMVLEIDDNVQVDYRQYAQLAEKYGG